MVSTTGGSIAPRSGKPSACRLSGNVDLDSNTLLIVAILIVGLIGFGLVVGGGRPASGPDSGPLAGIRAVVDQSIGMHLVRRLSGPPAEPVPGQIDAGPRRRILRDAGAGLVGIAAVALIAVLVVPGVGGGHPTSSFLSVSRAHPPTPKPSTAPASAATSASPASGLVESFVGPSVGKSTTPARISWSGSAAGNGIARYELQVSVDGGAFTTVKLPSATASSIVRTHTDGRSYRYRVRATDRQGKVGAWESGPTLKPGRIQDTSTGIKYKGSWITKSNVSTSGGTHRYASSSSARASIKGSFRDVAWVATTNPKGGSAQVRIDGVLAATIDLRSSTTKYRQIVFSRHFEKPGTHTMEIRPIGRGAIDLDAFLVMR